MVGNISHLFLCFMEFRDELSIRPWDLRGLSAPVVLERLWVWCSLDCYTCAVALILAQASLKAGWDSSKLAKDYSEWDLAPDWGITTEQGWAADQAVEMLEGLWVKEVCNSCSCSLDSNWSRVSKPDKRSRQCVVGEWPIWGLRPTQTSF